MNSALYIDVMIQD